MGMRGGVERVIGQKKVYRTMQYDYPKRCRPSVLYIVNGYIVHKMDFIVCSMAHIFTLQRYAIYIVKHTKLHNFIFDPRCPEKSKEHKQALTNIL
jgi:hypothetical protein